MKRALFLFVVLVGSGFAFGLAAQQPSEFTDEQTAKVEELFTKANDQLAAKQFEEALGNYRSALEIMPDDPAILYNGGFAAMLKGDNALATDLWNKLKAIDPDDWQVRAKLIQAYQRLDKTEERDAERVELIDLWKSGKIKELTEQIEFCRDRFTAGGRDILAFELFEFKGPRGRRYVFSILNDKGEEDFQISLGSYDTTNAIWQETTKPKPKEGVRLFHLDGYYGNGSHATFGMFAGEPRYEATKQMVIDILNKKSKPISASIVN